MTTTACMMIITILEAANEQAEAGNGWRARGTGGRRWRTCSPVVGVVRLTLLALYPHLPPSSFVALAVDGALFAPAAAPA